MFEQSIQDAADRWQTAGWVLIDGLIPADQVGAAYQELERGPITANTRPGPTRRSDQPVTLRFRESQFDGTTLFPFPDAPLLNRLFVHPALTAFARAALETDDVRIYQSRVWSKYGDHTNYAQPHHIDRNHSLVPIRQGPGWGHVECFLYLHDTDESNGAPKLVPADAAGRNGLGIGTGIGGAGTGMPIGRKDAPHLYEHEVSAAGAAGSLLAYRSDVWHRGVDIARGAERHIAVIAYRPAHVDWIGFDAHEPLVNRPDFVAFAEECSPDELALFGVPRPGHAFWTPDVLAAMARIYPGLNLEPWYEQLTQGA